MGKKSQASKNQQQKHKRVIINQIKITIIDNRQYQMNQMIK